MTDPVRCNPHRSKAQRPSADEKTPLLQKTKAPEEQEEAWRSMSREEVLRRKFPNPITIAQLLYGTELIRHYVT